VPKLQGTDGQVPIPVEDSQTSDFGERVQGRKIKGGAAPHKEVWGNPRPRPAGASCRFSRGLGLFWRAIPARH
jgi:hypothetical protein